MPSAKNTEMEAAEYRVVGPPGCGKTTWLGDQVQQAVESLVLRAAVMACRIRPRRRLFWAIGTARACRLRFRATLAAPTVGVVLSCLNPNSYPGG